MLKQDQELADGLGAAFDLSEDAVDVVADQAGEAEARRERVDERPEADALDDALNPDRGPDYFAHDFVGHDPSLIPDWRASSRHRR